MSNENTANFNTDKDDEIDLRELILVLLKNWKTIIVSTAVIAIIVIIYANVLPNQYITQTTAVATKGASQTSQMAGLAALAGINMSSGGSDVNLMNYIDVLVENTAFNEKIIEQKWVIQRLQTKNEIRERAPLVFDTLTLAQFWEFKAPDTTIPNWEYKYKMRQIGMLRNPKNKFIAIEKDKTKGTIAIKTRFENPSLSFEVHKFLIQYLSEYIEKDYLNRGKEKREFVEERVVELKDNLSKAEARLANFRERNLTVQSPSVILEGERLQRDVVLQTAVYTELVKQLELARIDEKKETPAFEIIKEADYPLGPSEPNRKLLYLIGIFGGFFAGIFIVFTKEWVLSIININKNA